MLLTLQIENIDGNVLAQNTASDRINLVYTNEYNSGDRIVIESDTANCYLIVQLEDSMPKTFVFMGENRHVMNIPFDEKRVSYSPKSFTGNVHLLTARCATRQEIAMYKNLAFNPFDCHENTCLFPHSYANVETRGEAVFASRNAMDGVYANNSHGAWPYLSWGINRNSDAEMRIDFGRTVNIDKVVLTTRADFPHDSWWVQATMKFSDGSKITFPLTKTEYPQVIEFAPRNVEWAVLCELIKADNESPFPALSQIEIWGNEI